MQAAYPGEQPGPSCKLRSAAEPTWGWVSSKGNVQYNELLGVSNHHGKVGFQASRELAPCMMHIESSW